MEHNEREAYKSEGWGKFYSGETPEEQAEGLFMVIEAHWHRNPNAPSLQEYARHWLWANAERYRGEAVDILARKYPYPAKPKIKKRYSDWNSYNNPAYK